MYMGKITLSALQSFKVRECLKSLPMLGDCDDDQLLFLFHCRHSRKIILKTELALTLSGFLMQLCKYILSIIIVIIFIITFITASTKQLRTLVDVFCWMLHLMRYIPTTEYRSVTFQPNSPTAHPIYLVNKKKWKKWERNKLECCFSNSRRNTYYTTR